ncbi:hypothetical protein BKA57DRAFT_465432 [Linnemannia elongata]|nr:hypothetical protein BKA57DRAFT_465432 [Linnemannia elongata]
MFLSPRKAVTVNKRQWAVMGCTIAAHLFIKYALLSLWFPPILAFFYFAWLREGVILHPFLSLFFSPSRLPAPLNI